MLRLCLQAAAALAHLQRVAELAQHGIFRPGQELHPASDVEVSGIGIIDLIGQVERLALLGQQISLPRLPRQADEQQREAQRSEEHTSELQSIMRISYADIC